VSEPDEGWPVPVVVDGVRYAIHLPAFDGPLDLLLHLIQREELSIFDIPISRLTRAYLATLEEMRRQQMEPASDFLVVAATLLQIKSRMLLPRPPGLSDIEAETPEDPRADLVRQLLEYQRFREVAEGLGGLPRLDWHLFDRPTGQDRPEDDEEEALAAQDVYRLAAAFRSLIAKIHYEAPHEIDVERISIGERIAQIADRLAREGTLTFEQLCAGARHREELITTFLAMLEMARLKLIRLTQGDRLADVYVEARVGSIGVAGEQAAGLMD
jgi:segregation and condensation protein A